MVLQRGRKVPIWGTVQPNEWIAVSFRHQTLRAQADAEGRFRVEIGPFEAGGPDPLFIGGQRRKAVRDVMVGEVWLCAGQSNMDWSVQQSQDAEAEITAATFPQIRLFQTKKGVAGEPQADTEGSWQACAPETVAGFSAVGYSFGRALHQQLGVPIGLIQSAVGGTPAEAWTSRGALEADPALRPLVEKWDAIVRDHPQRLAEWQAAVDQAKAAGAEPPAEPPGPTHTHRASGLYNAMIAPLVPFALAGAIWYQGESNAARAHQYRALFPALILDWRRAWDFDLPFLFVQLASYKVAQPQAWAELREAQLRALTLPHTGMAVTIDIGDPADIHPGNKQEVGRRLSLWALAQVYGVDVPYSGPLFERAAVEGDAIRVHFRHAGGLAARGGEALRGLEIAAEGDFVEAQASIDGETVLVRSASVPRPAHVRYAWTDDAMHANLVNAAGLPASPFRSDDRPGITAAAK